MLEISQLFWFEDIFVSQMIYAIVYDCSFIAEIHNWAKVWIAYTEYTISNATIVEEMNTLWECRYESGIQKKRKVFAFVYVYSIGTFEMTHFLQTSL